jgi:hypothetical protein
MRKGGGPQFSFDSVDFVYALAADDAGVYWIGPVDGGLEYGVFSAHAPFGAVTLLAKPSSVGSGIALDPDYVYFTGTPPIQRIPRNGGAPETLVGDASPYDLEVDDAYVYWSEGFTGSDFAIKKAPKSGGAPSVIATGQGAFLDLAVDEHCVYWADLYGGRIVRAPK